MRLILPARICHDRELSVSGEDVAILFEPATKSSWSVKENVLEISLTGDDAKALAGSLKPKVGTYQLPGFSNFRIQIEKTEIQDNHGEVVEVIG